MIKRTATVIVLVTLLTVSLNAFMAGNESCGAFTCGCGDSREGDVYGIIPSGMTLGQLIAEGGAYFLESNANYQQFLSCFEKSEVTGLDFKSLGDGIQSAVSSMKKAQETYLNLCTTAAPIPYNSGVIALLMDFNYKAFQSRNKLVSPIFNRVTRLLVHGDVKGVYQQFYQNSGDILNTLETIQESVQRGIAPNLQQLWQLNQLYAETELFSQYVAQVFFAI